MNAGYLSIGFLLDFALHIAISYSKWVREKQGKTDSLFGRKQIEIIALQHTGRYFFFFFIAALLHSFATLGHLVIALEE